MWDHWPIGWLNSQASDWKPGSPYSYSFGSIGQFFVPEGKPYTSFVDDYFGNSQDMELNRWTARRVFYVLIGTARDWNDIRRIGRNWLDKGATSPSPRALPISNSEQAVYEKGTGTFLAETWADWARATPDTAGGGTTHFSRLRLLPGRMYQSSLFVLVHARVQFVGVRIRVATTTSFAGKRDLSRSETCAFVSCADRKSQRLSQACKMRMSFQFSVTAGGFAVREPACRAACKV